MSEVDYDEIKSTVRLTWHPQIVCLCGSTKFKDAFAKAALEEGLAGRIVLSVTGFGHADKLFTEYGGHITPELKKKLDILHFQKIELADEILVLNVGGYIGPSTRNEIRYATELGKKIRYLEEDGND